MGKVILIKISKLFLTCTTLIFILMSLVGIQYTNPLNFPVILEKGNIYEKDFKITAVSLYRIELECERKLPQKDLECLLGISEGKSAEEECKKYYRNNIVDISWQVWDEKGIVTSGDDPGNVVNMGSWGSTIGKTLGTISEGVLKKGRKYLFKVRINKSAPELAVTNPCLKLNYAYIHNEESAAGQVIIIILGIGIFVIVGLIIVVRELIIKHYPLNKTAKR